MVSGHFIAFEGIDQSGKRTQSRLLASKLRRAGYRVASISFPDYTTPIGRRIRAYLGGSRLPAHAVHMLYSANRWERGEKISRLIEQGKVAIADRYTASNLAYGLARGIDLDWLLNLDRGLPEPEAVIVVDVGPRISLERKPRRRDAHERDLEFLKRVRENYLQLSARFGWKVVDGGRPRDQVADDIHSHVISVLQS